MVIDPSADRAVYKQLADLIRNQILNGEFEPGRRLPAQKDYMQEHGISRLSVDRAMHVLRNEGLIVTKRGGSRVASVKIRETLHLCQGEISARMPTMLERTEHKINEGVPILIVKDHGDDKIFPADQFNIRIQADKTDGTPSATDRRNVSTD